MTAIDTNVLIALWNEDELLNRAAQQALDQAACTGGLVVTGAVYAELLANPARTEPMLDNFFKKTRIEIDWRLSEAVWRAAGSAYRGYCGRRKSSRGDVPRGLLTDFVIGAHASVNGCALLTLDQRLYRAAFPALQVLSF